MYVRDFDFLNANTEVNTLSVIVQDDGLYCSALDKNQTMLAHKTFAGIRFSDDQQMQQLQTDKFFTSGYHRILFTIMNKKYFFMPEIREDIVQTVDSLAHKQVFVDKIAGSKSYNHFGITNHQKKMMDNLSIGKQTTIHHFANTLAMYYLHHPGNVIHVHVEQDELHIYVQKNGVFYVYKCVDAVSIEDILYFILAFYKECGLDCAKDTLILSGWLEANSALFTQIYGYIARVHWVDDSTFRVSGQTSDATKDHFYFAHFANSLCAS
jgi:hypothetical protein